MSEIKRFIEIRDRIVEEAIAAAAKDESSNVAQVYAFTAALDAGLSSDEAHEIARTAAEECPF